MAGVEQISGKLEGVNGTGIKLYRFSFTPNGAGAPTNVTNGRGSGIASIVRLSAGLFSVQLVDTAPGNFLGMVSGATAAVGGACIGCHLELDYTNTTLTTGLCVVAAVLANGTRGDITAATGEVLHGVLMFSKDPSTTN